MNMNELNVFSAVDDTISCVHEPEGDCIVVLHGSEQMFTIERISTKGAPIYNNWVIQCWVWENYLDCISDFMTLRGAV